MVLANKHANTHISQLKIITDAKLSRISNGRHNSTVVGESEKELTGEQQRKSALSKSCKNFFHFRMFEP